MPVLTPPARSNPSWYAELMTEGAPAVVWELPPWANVIDFSAQALPHTGADYPSTIGISVIGQHFTLEDFMRLVGNNDYLQGLYSAHAPVEGGPSSDPRRLHFAVAAQHQVVPRDLEEALSTAISAWLQEKAEANVGVRSPAGMAYLLSHVPDFISIIVPSTTTHAVITWADASLYGIHVPLPADILDDRDALDRLTASMTSWFQADELDMTISISDGVIKINRLHEVMYPLGQVLERLAAVLKRVMMEKLGGNQPLITDVAVHILTPPTRVLVPA